MTRQQILEAIVKMCLLKEENPNINFSAECRERGWDPLKVRLYISTPPKWVLEKLTASQRARLDGFAKRGAETVTPIPD